MTITINAKNETRTNELPLRRKLPRIDFKTTGPSVKCITPGWQIRQSGRTAVLELGDGFHLPVKMEFTLEFNAKVGPSDICRKRVTTRIPLHVVTVNDKWNPNDIRLPPEVTCREPHLVNDKPSTASVEKLAERIQHRSATDLYWIYGSTACGKTKFVSDLVALLNPEWRVIRLFDLAFFNPPSSDKAFSATKDQVRAAILREVRGTSEKVPLVFLLDEFDCLASMCSDSAHVAEILGALDSILDDLNQNPTEGSAPSIAIVVDIMRPELRRDDYNKGVGRTVCLCELQGRFSVEHIRQLLEKLPPLLEDQEKNLIDQVYSWTRGQPLLVNAMLYLYFKCLQQEEDEETFKYNKRVFDGAEWRQRLPESDTLHEAIEHILKAVRKQRNDKEFPFDRLGVDEERLLQDLALSQPRELETAEERSFTILKDRGLVVQLPSCGAAVGTVDIPLIRAYFRDQLPRPKPTE